MPGPDAPPPRPGPALVGREEFLALTRRRLAGAARGGGQLLLVAGEAGIGKTRLLGHAVAMAEESGFAVVRGTAFPDDAQVSGALLLDLAGQLKRAHDRNSQTVGVALAERLRGPTDGGGDQHRRRRLLVQDLTDALAALAPDRLLLLVLEDLHWADGLSLEVLGHVAPALARHHLLVMVAFRTDELFPGSPIREWRARLLTQRVAEEVRLPRLSATETGDVVGAILGHAVPADVLALLHQRSDGIPLHVEELVAAAGGLDASTALDELSVPDTLGDAVLHRLARVDSTTREVAGAAAVIGRSFDFDRLVLVTGLKPEAVDQSLRTLQSLYLVQPSPDGGFDFRHALIRDTLYRDVALPRRRQLHGRVAGAVVERGDSAAVAATHFDLAGQSAPAFRYALLAGQQAAGLSAHREALAMFRRAQRHPPSDRSVDERAALLTAIAVEAAAVDDNAAAAAAYREVHEIWAAAGRILEAAAVVAAWVAALHLLGESLELRAGRLTDALASLDRLDRGDDPAVAAVRADLTSALAAAYMLDRRLEQAIAYGEQSRAITGGLTGTPTALNTAVTLGSVLVFAGREEGWALLEDATADAVADRQEAEASRAYRMLGSSASVLVEYARAKRALADGLAFSADVELWNHHHYMAAHLAHVQWATGDWAAARSTAEHALADGRGGITTRITSLYVLGYLRLGQPDAEVLLEEALGLGRSMAELQRISPPLWGLAEHALLTGDPGRAVDLCDEGYALSAEVADAAYLFPFAVTGLRARLATAGPPAASGWLEQVEPALTRRAIPGTLPTLAHCRGLLQLAAGDLPAARASLLTAEVAWRARSRFWEGCWAQLDLSRCSSAMRRPGEAAAHATSALSAAETSGASALTAAARAVLAPPAAGTPAWHPLSSREHQVALLVSQGLTNREIAAALFLAPKTVSSHVEHILAKLSASRRAEIGAWVSRVGVNDKQ